MAYFTKDSPEFWNRYPVGLEAFAQNMQSLGITPATLFVMGEDGDATAPAAFIFTQEPGNVQLRHSHPCARFEIVLEGSMTNEFGVKLHPGDVMISAKDEAYGPHIAGPDGCRTLEIFGALRGAHTVIVHVDGKEIPYDVNSVEAFQETMAEIQGTDAPA